MLQIRAATEQDAGGIAHVHVESWRTTYAGIVPESYLASLNEAERVPLWQDWLSRQIEVYVAEADGRIVGFISGGRMRETLESYDAELFAIYLLEQAQGRGLGRALLRTLADSLRTQGFKSLAVWVLEGNRSTHFYERAGALPVSSKEMEIGGAMLPVVAFGWPDLELIASPI